MLARPGLVRGSGRLPRVSFEFDAAAGLLAAGMSFTRASSATYFDQAGVLQSAPADVPRFTYLGGSLLGLWLEEATTNLLLNTAVLETQTVAVAAVVHTLSFTGTGSIALSGASVVGPLVGTGAGNRVALSFTPTAGNLTLTVTGDVRLAQLEAQPFASSYIGSGATAAVRERDALTLPANVVDGDAGSFAARFMLPRPGGGTSGGTVLFLSPGGVTTDCIRIVTINDVPRIVESVANSPTVISDRPSAATNVFAGCAAAWDAASFVCAWDGGAPVEDTTRGPLGAFPVNRVNWGQTTDGAGIILRYLRFWKGTKLSAARVQAESAKAA